MFPSNLRTRREPSAERTFIISYYSEVSAEITVKVYESSPQVEVEADHPIDGVPIQDWYHFCEESETDVSVEADDVGHAIVKMAARLYPGCKQLLDEQYDYDEPLFEKFVRDLFLAFVAGRVVRPDDWQHNVGEKLIARTKRDRAIDRKI